MIPAWIDVARTTDKESALRLDARYGTDSADRILAALHERLGILFEER